MKQLLKHYQEVGKKADPDNWTAYSFQDVHYNRRNGEKLESTVTRYLWDVQPEDVGITSSCGHSKEEMDGYLLENQLEKLQIEEALHGHWERNHKWAYTLKNIDSVDGTPGVDWGFIFKEWLQEELNKLED